VPRSRRRRFRPRRAQLQYLPCRLGDATDVSQDHRRGAGRWLVALLLAVGVQSRPSGRAGSDAISFGQSDEWHSSGRFASTSIQMLVPRVAK